MTDSQPHPERRMHARLLAGLFLWLLASGPAPVQASTSPGQTLEALVELGLTRPGEAEAALRQSLADEELEPRERALRHRELAVLLRNRGEIQQARRELMLLQEQLDGLGDPELEASFLHVLGTLDAEEGQLDRALEHFHQAYLFHQQRENHRGMMAMGNAIGAVHQLGENHPQAREYFERTLELARRHDDIRWQVTALGNLAISVTELEGAPAGLQLELQALAMAREQGNPRELAIRLANVCRLQEAVGDLATAEDVCRQAVQRLEEAGPVRFLAGTHMVRGDLHRRQGRLVEATEAYRQALALAESRIPTVERPVRERLSEIFRSQGELALAIEQLDALLAIRAELGSDERARLMSELQARFDLQLAETQIAQLQRESAWQSQQLRQRLWAIVASLGALVMALLLTGLLYRAYRQRVQLQHTVSSRNRELEQALATIRELAARDPLTGLYNRRAFQEIAQHTIARAQRTRQPMVVLLADIDEFKALNDNHGHAVGDEVLCEVSRRMQRALRESDLLCRWGGEEFVCLYCNASMREALQVTTRVRDGLAQTPIQTSAGPFRVTMTYGLARLDADFDQALQEADRALYLGKRAGRDRIEAIVSGEDQRPAAPDQREIKR